MLNKDKDFHVQSLRLPPNLKPETLNCIETFSKSGIKFTRVVSAGPFHVEVRNSVQRLNGEVMDFLVAKVDQYGNVIEWGPFADPPTPKKWVEREVILADGDFFARHSTRIHD